MRFRIISDLIAHAGRQDEMATVFEFGVQLPFKTEQNMPFFAPVIGKISGTVFDHPHANVAKLAGAPGCCARLAPMLGPLNEIPVRGAKRQMIDSHDIDQSFAEISLPRVAMPSRIFSGGTVTKLRRSVLFSAWFA
jgi:hypothetical protein